MVFTELKSGLSTWGHRLLSICLAGLMALGLNILPAQAIAPLTPETCQAFQQTALRPALSEAIETFFNQNTNFEIKNQIAAQWHLWDGDAVWERAVTEASDRLKADTQILDKFASSWLPEKAAGLADRITTSAFSDHEFQSVLGQISTKIGNRIANNIELATLTSSSFAVQCLQKFIDRQYSDTFFNLFSQQSEKSAQRGVDASIDYLSNLQQDYLKSHQDFLGGTALVATAQITRQVTKTTAKRVTQQLGKRVLGRLGSGVVPVVGEVIGAGLLITDVAQSFSGAFDSIQTQLKKPEVKTQIQTEIAKSINQGLDSEAPQIAKAIANELYAEWLDFEHDYQDLLNLTQESPQLKTLVADAALIPKITDLIGLALDHMGRQNLLAAIEDGSFAQALRLPQSSYGIMEATGSIKEAVDWYNLAGSGQIDTVVRLKLYQSLNFAEIDRPFLQGLLALKSESLIQKIAAVHHPSAQILLNLTNPQWTQLAETLSGEDLERLAQHLATLSGQAADLLMAFLSQDSSDTVRNDAVMNHIVQSADIAKAIALWEGRSRQFQPMQFFTDVGAVVQGQVAWALFRDIYRNGAIAILGVSLAIIVLVFFKIFFWVAQQILSLRQQQVSLEILKQQADHDKE